MQFYPEYERKLLDFVNPINATCVTKYRQNILFQMPTCSRRSKILKNKNKMSEKSFYLKIEDKNSHPCTFYLHSTT